MRLKQILAPYDERTRRALVYSVKDGVLWSLMFGLSENYLTPLAVIFGAQAIHTSLIQGMGQLGVAVSQLAGASYLQRHPTRKILTLVGNAVHALSWLVVFFGAYFLKSPWIILIAYAIGTAVSNFAGPGWNSWMNDLVPSKIRGAYWGKRNNIMGIAQFAAILGSGLALQFAQPHGFSLPVFALMFCLAFVFRLSSIYYLNATYEPPMECPPEAERMHFLPFLRDLGQNPFGRFVIFSVLTTLVVNLMVPLVSIHLLKGLGLNYIEYTLVTMASMVMNFLAMSYWGPLGDRFGSYRVITVTAALLPFIAIAWAFVRPTPALIVLQLFSGFVWAGFNLSTSTYIFDSVSRAHTAKSIAYFQFLNSFAAFLGSLAGGGLSLLTPHIAVGFFHGQRLELVFLLSGLLRGLVAALLLKNFSEVRKVESAPPLRYFYIYQPLTVFFARIQSLAELFKDGRHEDE